MSSRQILSIISSTTYSPNIRLVDGIGLSGLTHSFLCRATVCGAASKFTCLAPNSLMIFAMAAPLLEKMLLALPD